MTRLLRNYDEGGDASLWTWFGAFQASVDFWVMGPIACHRVWWLHGHLPQLIWLAWTKAAGLLPNQIWLYEHVFWNPPCGKAGRDYWSQFLGGSWSIQSLTFPSSMVFAEDWEFFSDSVKQLSTLFYFDHISWCCTFCRVHWPTSLFALIGLLEYANLGKEHDMWAASTPAKQNI